MKQLTILFPDDVDIDLSAVIKHAIELKLETVTGPLPPPPRRRNFREDMTTLQCIMRHYSPESYFSVESAMRWLKEAGFSDNATVLWRLQQSGHIRKVGKGRRQFLKPLEAPPAKEITFDNN